MHTSFLWLILQEFYITNVLNKQILYSNRISTSDKFIHLHTYRNIYFYCRMFTFGKRKSSFCWTQHFRVRINFVFLILASWVGDCIVMLLMMYCQAELQTLIVQFYSILTRVNFSNTWNWRLKLKFHFNFALGSVSLSNQRVKL